MIRINKVLGYGHETIPNIDWEWLYEQKNEDFLNFIEQDEEKIVDFFMSLTEHKEKHISINLKIIKSFKKKNKPNDFFFYEDEYDKIFIVQPFWENKTWRRTDDAIDYYEENEIYSGNRTRIFKIKKWHLPLG